jgi:glutathione S-transferase
MHPIELLGMPGSPYTRKMLSLLRYRRIAHRVLWGSHFDPPKGYPAPKVKLLPTFYFPTAHGIEAVVDSTPIIQRLENEHSARSVRPDDPLLNFLDLLIEDFADEWLTKAMFHYRWHYAEDGAHAAPLLIYSLHPQLNSTKAKAMGGDIAQRQISRLPVVGSSDVTTPVIESSFERLVGIMDRIIARQGFVLGSRPSSADFAIFGQLTQLGVIDPTPARYLERHSPRLRAWIDLMEDLSGHTSDSWLTPASAHDHVGEMLSEIGRVYAPFLLANEQAILKGHAEFEARIDGQLWRQAVFPYQHKCLDVLRQARISLQPEVRQALDSLLAGTGCESLFAPPTNLTKVQA